MIYVAVGINYNDSDIIMIMGLMFLVINVLYHYNHDYYYGLYHYTYWCLAGNGWEWGNGIIIDSYYGSFPHSLLSTSKYN